METILRRAATDAVSLAQQRARVDTGRMQGSIRIVSVTSVRAIVRSGTPSVYWSIFNEFGTIKMSAQPFMRPAAYIVGGRLPSYAADLEGMLVG